MEIARQVLSVVFVFGLLGAMVWTLRRGGKLSLGPWKGVKRTRALEAIERLPLSAQHSLHLVRIDDRVVVIATHPQGCALLADARGERHNGASA